MHSFLDFVITILQASKLLDKNTLWSNQLVHQMTCFDFSSPPLAEAKNQGGNWVEDNGGKVVRSTSDRYTRWNMPRLSQVTATQCTLFGLPAISSLFSWKLIRSFDHKIGSHSSQQTGHVDHKFTIRIRRQCFPNQSCSCFATHMMHVSQYKIRLHECDKRSKK